MARNMDHARLGGLCSIGRAVRTVGILKHQSSASEQRSGTVCTVLDDEVVWTKQIVKTKWQTSRRHRKKRDLSLIKIVK